MSELVSIVIPTYNRSISLVRAIQSALAQEYVPVELVVVNDGGNVRDVAEVIKEFGDRVELIHHEHNLGVSAARNSGIAHANGTFVLFLDDDDELEPSFIAKAVSAFEKRVDVVLGYTRLSCEVPDKHYYRIEKYNSLLFDRYHFHIDHWAYFLQYMPGIHSILFRKQVLESVMFDEESRYGEDRLLMMKLRHLGVQMKPVGVLAGFYHFRQHVGVEENMCEFIQKVRLLPLHNSAKAYLHLLACYYELRSRNIFRAVASFFSSLKSPYILVKQFILYLRLYILR